MQVVFHLPCKRHMYASRPEGTISEYHFLKDCTPVEVKLCPISALTITLREGFYVVQIFVFSPSPCIVLLSLYASRVFTRYPFWRLYMDIRLLKSSLQKLYGHHKPVDRYEISIVHMSMKLFPFTYIVFFPLWLTILLSDLTLWVTRVL
jgi:hypothetical protein